jgi:hypothetical protein
VALDNGRTIAALGNSVISANAYLGVAPIVEALKDGADVVITGRAADPAIFMAPLIVEFGWPMDDWTLLGRGTLVGHLLECAGQVTGGYFADPGAKDAPDLARLGFPIGEVREDRELVVTKVAGSGGVCRIWVSWVPPLRRQPRGHPCFRSSASSPARREGGATKSPSQAHCISPRRASCSPLAPCRPRRRSPRPARPSQA